MKTTTKFLAAWLILSTAQLTTAAPVSFTPLGDFPGGTFSSLGFGVSADGSVAVGRGDIASGSEAFRWTSGTGLVGLGDLPGGIFSSQANDASVDGSVIVGSGQTAVGAEAFRWTAGTGMVGLGDLAGGLTESRARRTSADGSVVVGESSSASGNEAFRWTSGTGMTGLGDLPGGGFFSNATGVSADGSVIVGAGESTSGPQAFRWTSGTGMTGLGDLPGGDFLSAAGGISADGSTIVGSSFSTDGLEAFRWTSDTGMVGLGALSGTNFFSNARDASADGSVIVGQSILEPFIEAFIWDESNGMRRLHDVLVNDHGLDLTGWILFDAIGISDDGNTIVGWGINPAGDSEAWVAVVPEPSTFILAALGLVALGFCAIRRRRAACVRFTQSIGDERHCARRALMKTTTAFAFLILALSCTSAAYAGSIFGSGANSFEIEFVTIGNPGNAADDISSNPSFAGSVAETYRIGKFEISEDMIDKANALGGLGITHDGRGPNKPASSISWFEAARFVNWLNFSSGFSPAYKTDGGGNFLLWQPGDLGYDPNNLYRNSLASYFLPSGDEWYKAAFYDPTGGTYFNFPTGNDTAPTAVASGIAAGTAVYGQSFATGPADITLAGGLSPYGTMGQGGNVYEWQETQFDLLNDSTSSNRGLRGGSWNVVNSLTLAMSGRISGAPTNEFNNIGFRVASVPEPSSLLLGALAAVGFLILRRSLR